MLKNLFVTIVFVFSMSLPIAASDKVIIIKQNNHWQIQVNEQPFFIKGMTWSPTPIGKNYSYKLFEQPEDIIKAVIKRDMTLMKAMGCNTIRQTYDFPLKWIKYIHENYGMYFIINDFSGRYGLTIDGKFIWQTNYADPKTRLLIKQRWRDIVKKYKNCPGILAYAIGNENNYGLEWKSAEIENLPAGERFKAKAGFLYSLFNEVAEIIKQEDPNHPVCIINGDIQYLSLIAKTCPTIDFLGCNSYRGKSFNNLFDEVDKILGKPFFLGETGCDAFNSKTDREDQQAQADYIAANWQEIYYNAANNGGRANCLGGLVFEWTDEWWKHGQQHRLNIQDKTATWRNGGYTFDFGKGNNMNEEWFGICSIDPKKQAGIHLIHPRMSYYILKQIWSHSPYQMNEEKLKRFKFDFKAAAKAAGNQN